MKRIGDLPFNFQFGTCGTFNINALPTILLCFDDFERRKCRSLTRRNDGTLGEFEIDKIAVPNSTHEHEYVTLANNKGFPMILGGWDNNKLEMLNTLENTFSWLEYEGTDYPFSDT